MHPNADVHNQHEPQQMLIITPTNTLQNPDQKDPLQRKSPPHHHHFRKRYDLHENTP